MSENSAIQWTDHTFNPWWGCVKVSPGCKHCYAETFSNRYGHDVWGPNKPRRIFKDSHWREPLKWNAKAEKEGRRARVFSGSMCDVFEDAPQLEGERARLFTLIEQTPWLDWLLLTKRPENVNDMVADFAGDCAWLDRGNVWLGTSVENQEWADKRIPQLLNTFANTRFLSAEPLLGEMWIPEYLGRGRVDWVIVGGESGPGCRSMKIDWARSLYYQADEAGIAFFMKQLGGYPDKRGKLAQMPDDLRIREFPARKRDLHHLEQTG